MNIRKQIKHLFNGIILIGTLAIVLLVAITSIGNISYNNPVNRMAASVQEEFPQPTVPDGMLELVDPSLAASILQTFFDLTAPCDDPNQFRQWAASLYLKRLAAALTIIRDGEHQYIGIIEIWADTFSNPGFKPHRQFAISLSYVDPETNKDHSCLVFTGADMVLDNVDALFEQQSKAP